MQRITRTLTQFSLLYCGLASQELRNKHTHGGFWVTEMLSSEGKCKDHLLIRTGGVHSYGSTRIGDMRGRTRLPKYGIFQQSDDLPSQSELIRHMEQKWSFASKSDKANSGDGGTKEETISVTFVDKDGEEKTIQVPVGMSMLEAAHQNDIDLEGACEGSLACSTCHVIVMDENYYNKLEEPTDEENDMLDLAFGLTETSRLGCQVYSFPHGMKVQMFVCTLVKIDLKDINATKLLRLCSMMLINLRIAGLGLARKFSYQGKKSKKFRKGYGVIKYSI